MTRGGPFGYEVDGAPLARVPLLPFSALLDWADAIEHGTGDQWLMATLRRPEVLAAIDVGSPAFGRVLQEHVMGKTVLAGRARRSAIKYVLRMTGRSTPLGLFAGTLRVDIETRTNLRLRPRTDARIFPRLDGVALFRALRQLLADPEFRASARLQINQSAYEWGGRLHYVEAFAGREHVTPYARSTAKVDVPLRLVLEFVRRCDGATFTSVVRTLTDAGFPAADAAEYVNQLIDEQILVAEQAMPLLNEVPADRAAELVDNYAGRSPVPRQLREIVAATRRARTSPLTDALASLAQAAAGAADAGFVSAEAPACDVQLCLSGNVTLGHDLMRRIEDAVRVLAQTHISGATSPVGILGRELDEFRRRFTDRYGDAAVPLPLAIDPDVGVGFRGAGVQVPEPIDPSRRWERRDRHLLNAVMTTLASGDHILRLTDEDIEKITTKREDRLPNGGTALVRVAVASDGGKSIYVSKFGGPTSTWLLGRFACGHPELERELRAIHERETSLVAYDCIDAEVIHAPTGDLLNIAARPKMRDYEIAFLGRAAAEPDRTLSIHDLLVTVQHDRIVLYSRSRRRVVRPHLTCAHAAQSAELPAAYRFLFAVACQGVDPLLMWQWGEEIDSLLFLPRVEYRSAVLSLARWRLTPTDLVPLVEAAEDAALDAARTLRTRLNLPRFIAALTPTDELLFDLENPDVVAVFRELAKKRRQLEVSEVFPEPGRSAMYGTDGQYMHEIVVPLRRSVRRAEPVPRPYHDDSEIQGTSFFGVPWLYLRIATGPRAAEQLLLSALAPVLERLIRENEIAGWFFVRYADPSHELRLRIRAATGGSTDVALRDILLCLRAPSTRELTAEVRIDTYRPEIRRYGGVAAMTCAEEVFMADSAAVLAGLVRASATGNDADPEWRMAFACMTTQQLLERLVESGEARLRILAHLAAAALAETAKDPEAVAARRRVLAQSFRAQRDALTSAAFVEAPEWRSLRDLCETYLGQADESISTLVGLSRQGALTTDYEDIVHSLLHMHLNRVFMEEPRHHERVVYDFLHQLNRSRAARVAQPMSAVAG